MFSCQPRTSTPVSSCFCFLYLFLRVCFSALCLHVSVHRNHPLPMMYVGSVSQFNCPYPRPTVSHNVAMASSMTAELVVSVKHHNRLHTRIRNDSCQNGTQKRAVRSRKTAAHVDLRMDILGQNQFQYLK